MRSAIIDIGSNSVRLVIYGPPRRAPAVLFNEKVAAGLGRGLAVDGRLEEKAIEVALRALARFNAIVSAMDVDECRVVATAAVRDAANGQDFIMAAAGLGVAIEIISGDAEAEASGYGVISAFPEADGIVGDLGGGSLELVRVGEGGVRDRLSLPLGVLRLAALRKRGKLAVTLERALKAADWPLHARGLPFYLVGGSWRALARIDMAVGEHPLQVLHAYAMSPEAPARLLPLLEPKPSALIEKLASSRLSVLGDATALLALLSDLLRSTRLVTSAAGLREGLLYQRLGTAERAADPLLAAARETGARHGRFEEHGDLVDGWIAPLFANEGVAERRLRHAACLLGDIAWDANPDFRAQRGADIALHENWVGIDGEGRALLAQALWTSFGEAGSPPPARTLAQPAALNQARQWGLAIRLAQRLSAGGAAPLRDSRLRVSPRRLELVLDDAALYGESVQKRHRALAQALGLEAARA